MAFGESPERIGGSAADGLVVVELSETGQLLGVHVQPGAYCRDDPPGLANMGDMVAEALVAAKAAAAARHSSMRSE